MPLLRTFRFQVKLRKSPEADAGASPRTEAPSGVALGDGAFQECSGLEIELDVKELIEGGRNDGVIRQIGRAKYKNLVLKRGMIHPESGAVNRELWIWLQGLAAGERPAPRYDGTVEVMSTGDNVVATWVFYRGLPVRVKGPELNAKTGEVALEELEIAHEGLRLDEA